MALLQVDGVNIPDPSKYTYGLQDVSASDAGRTEDALMQKNRVAQKRKLELEWQNIGPEKVSGILTAFNPEYVSVRYHDSMDNQYETRTFYVGDRSNVLYSFVTPTGIISTLKFNIIER